MRLNLLSLRAPRKAKKRLDKALTRAPNDPRLLSARAEVALMDEDPVAARGYLAKALKTSPTHGDALAMRYATCTVQDDRKCARKALKTNLKANPHDPRPHLKAASFLEAGHRYDRVLTELKLALKRDPDSAAAHAALGMSYARLADDKDAFAHLDTAFRADPYNVRTANVLNVLYDGVLKVMPVLKGEFVDLRVQRKYRRAFERTVLPFLQESYALLVKKYGMTPKQPLRVEIFPTSEQFSVRTVGLPRLGAHAVCFGHLITSRSPTERPFNWKMVLHHEMSHVFHIQASDGRVPRWLTEGLAMMESVWLDKRYHMRMERRAYDRLKAGELAKVRTFNLAFSQARNMQSIVDAYYQAMKLTRYLSDTYGFAKVAKLVAAHKSGKSTAVLVKQVLGITPERLDTDFAVWLAKDLARFDGDFHPARAAIRKMLRGQGAAKRKDPTLISLRRAMQALKRGDPSAARRALDEVMQRARDPKATAVAGPQLCTVGFLISELAMARRDWPVLEANSRRLIKLPGCDGVQQRLWLARAIRANGGNNKNAGKGKGKGKQSELLSHLRRAAAIDPMNVTVKRFWLAILAKDAPETERRRLMREILALSPNASAMGGQLASLAWRRLAPTLDVLAGTAPKPHAKVGGMVAFMAAAKKSAAKKPVAKTAAANKGAAAAATPGNGPLSAADRRALIGDVAIGARQLEETAPDTYAQAIWEARNAVAAGGLKRAMPVYRLAARRALRKKDRRAAWCELAKIARKTKEKEAQGEADRRCAAEGP